jgi:hypothetical protein
MYTILDPSATPLPNGLRLLEAPCNILETPNECRSLIEGKKRLCDAMVTTQNFYRTDASNDAEFACEVYLVDSRARQNILAYLVGTAWTCGVPLMNFGLARMRDSGELRAIIEAALPTAYASCESAQGRRLARAVDSAGRVLASDGGLGHSQPGRRMRGAGSSSGSYSASNNDSESDRIQVRTLFYAFLIFGVTVCATFLFAVVKKAPQYFPRWLVPPLGKKHHLYAAPASHVISTLRRRTSRLGDYLKDASVVRTSDKAKDDETKGTVTSMVTEETATSMMSELKALRQQVQQLVELDPRKKDLQSIACGPDRGPHEFAKGQSGIQRSMSNTKRHSSRAQSIEPVPLHTVYPTAHSRELGEDVQRMNSSADFV